jgi:uncharacterized repeat protein (TIGR04076 family)
VNNLKVKITVVKRFEPKDVIGEDFILPSGKKVVKCGLKKGESFISIDGNQPENFCSSAWAAIYPTVKMFRFGGNYPAFKPGTAYTTCPDGIRPVSFFVEKIED